MPSNFRNQLFEFFLKKNKNFKFEDIRTFLDKQFKSKKKYNYPIDNKTGKYDTTVAGMPVCSGLIDVLGKEVITKALNEIEKFTIGNAPNIINTYSIHDLWHVLFYFDERTSKDKNFLEKFAIEKLSIVNKKTKKDRAYNMKLKRQVTSVL